jgi:hypothetical protein
MRTIIHNGTGRAQLQRLAASTRGAAPLSSRMVVRRSPYTLSASPAAGHAVSRTPMRRRRREITASQVPAAALHGTTPAEIRGWRGDDEAVAVQPREQQVGLLARESHSWPGVAGIRAVGAPADTGAAAAMGPDAESRPPPSTAAKVANSLAVAAAFESRRRELEAQQSESRRLAELGRERRLVRASASVPVQQHQ